MVQLKPCPWCGEIPDNPVKDEYGYYAVSHRCSGMGMTTQRCNLRRLAIGQWNKRVNTLVDVPSLTTGSFNYDGQTLELITDNGKRIEIQL